MKYSFQDNASIFAALLRRDMKLFTASLPNLLIDLGIPLLAQVLTFGYLFPLLGMAGSMIIPVYLGSMTSLFIQLGFAFAMRVASDINTNRFIDYQRTLPFSNRWLFAYYIVSNMIESICILIPLIATGLYILRAEFTSFHLSYPLVAGVIIINVLFFATFFLTCALYFNFNWLMDNIWPRFITPLFCLGAVLIVWRQAYEWSPLFGYIMLLSPFTYAVEGMRSALLGSPYFISAYICMTALVGWIVVSVYFLKRGIAQKLDPVEW